MLERRASEQSLSDHYYRCDDSEGCYILCKTLEFLIF